MPNYLIELIAPKETVSPSVERASLVVEAATLEEAKKAALQLTEIESRYPEVFVSWRSECKNITCGHCLMVAISVKEIDQKASIRAEEIFEYYKGML